MARDSLTGDSMKLPIFIGIPNRNLNGCVHFIRPYDILNMVDCINYTTVIYREGMETRVMHTLLTATEIHEKIQEMEEQKDKYFFSDSGEG